MTCEETHFKPTFWRWFWGFMAFYGLLWAVSFLWTPAKEWATGLFYVWLAALALLGLGTIAFLMWTLSGGYSARLVAILCAIATSASIAIMLSMGICFSSANMR